MWMALKKLYNINPMMPLAVITISGLNCITQIRTFTVITIIRLRCDLKITFRDIKQRLTSSLTKLISVSICHLTLDGQNKLNINKKETEPTLKDRLTVKFLLL
jgi:hypothetical protein